MTTTLHRQSIQSFRGLLRTVNEVCIIYTYYVLFRYLVCKEQ